MTATFLVTVSIDSVDAMALNYTAQDIQQAVNDAGYDTPTPTHYWNRPSVGEASPTTPFGQ
jgi:hypothetical protein